MQHPPKMFRQQPASIIMSELQATMAKLSGIKKSLEDMLAENVSRAKHQGQQLFRSNFSPDLVGHHFTQAGKHIDALRKILPDLYGDFHVIKTVPETLMAATGSGKVQLRQFSRQQVERLVRDIEQVFEIRANSELEQPKVMPAPRRVFITHGRPADWREVQAHIEKDLKLDTIDLSQEPDLWQTTIEKLIDVADVCDSAVIVITGDDHDMAGNLRARENVMHEIGFFRGRYGRGRVVVLHEDAVSISTNLAGVVYVPFPKSGIGSAFHVLDRDLQAMYGL